MREATALMHRFRISGVPIVDEDERLVGIITNRDLQFERNLDRPLREAMTSDGLITAREGTTLDEAEQILAEHRIEKLPVVDEQRRAARASSRSRTSTSGVNIPTRTRISSADCASRRRSARRAISSRARAR